MLDINKNIFILFLISFVFVFSSCQKKTASGSANYNNEPRQIKSYEEVYQEDLTVLQEKKSEIEKHIQNYEYSIKYRRSILDDRESVEAKNAINKLANELLLLSKESLKNNEIISKISSAKDTYEGYKRYAENILNKYE